MCDSPLKLSKGIQFLLLAASISEGPSVELESFPSPLEVGGYDRRMRKLSISLCQEFAWDRKDDREVY